ncbi:MAG: helix-turn-helix domain-containing protein [Candidatus Woesearchaeota archaeon]
MLVKKDFLNKLKDFGLNSYEAKLWTALLSRGVATAGELSDIANVPRSRSYDVLESLEKKGFIIMKVGKPIKYVAVPPSEVVERVKKKIEKETKEQINNLDKIKKSEILSELETLHSQGIELVDPTEFSGALRGRHNIYNHYEILIKNAEKTINLMTTPEGLIRKSDALIRALSKAKEKGVKIKILTKNSPILQKLTKDIKEMVEIRYSDIEGRMIVVDKKSTIFVITDDKKTHPTYDSAIWSNSEYLSSTINSFFERHWEESK